LRAKGTARHGLREQNKLEKRQRIRAAVRTLFSRHGYETATLRQIAKRAHVGLGTLFNYAQDKRDLVFLVFNEGLSGVTDEALRASTTEKQLLSQLLGMFRPHFIFFARNPVLSRILLRDMTFYSEGKQAAEFLRIRARLFTGIENVVRSAQHDGQIHSDEDATLIARHFFLVFAGLLRWWISSRKPEPERGLSELKRLFELQIEGLAPKSPKRASGSKRGGGTKRLR
jgi:AcrR family transcriptional regulator